MPWAWAVSSAHSRAVLGLELLLGRALVLALRSPRRAVGDVGLLGGAQLLERAVDRLLGELTEQRLVGDDRRAVLELDQDARRARLVDLGLGEADDRRAVGVTVDLPVQRLRLRVGGVGLLAETQLRDLVRVEPVQVRGEGLAVTFAQRVAQRPSRIARELAAARARRWRPGRARPRRAPVRRR